MYTVFSLKKADGAKTLKMKSKRSRKVVKVSKLFTIYIFSSLKIYTLTKVN